MSTKEGKVNLAIVIPYYKIDFLEKTLISLATQTNKNFNVYMGDDCSPDSPLFILEKFKNLRVVYQKCQNRLGPSSLPAHWVRCLAMLANEEWFMILGDDDVVSPNLVDVFYQQLQNVECCKLNVIKFSSQEISQDDVNVSPAYKFSTIENSLDLYIDKINRITRSSLSEHIFRRSEYDRQGIFDNPLAWHSDDMMILQYSHFKDVYCVNDATVFIRQSYKNISGWGNLYPREKRDASIRFYKKLLTVYKDKLNKLNASVLCKHLLNITNGDSEGAGIFDILSMCYSVLGPIETTDIFCQLKYPRSYLLKKIGAVNLDKMAEESIIDLLLLSRAGYGFGRKIPSPANFKIKRIDATKEDSVWPKIRKVMASSLKKDDEVVIITFDDVEITDEYSQKKLIEHIFLGYLCNADILLGDCFGEHFKIQIINSLHRIDQFSRAGFIVLFRKIFEKIVSYNFDGINNVALMINEVSSQKFAIYPFITTQKASLNNKIIL